MNNDVFNEKEDAMAGAGSCGESNVLNIFRSIEGREPFDEPIDVVTPPVETGTVSEWEKVLCDMDRSQEDQ
jgi:hypothetical protein